MDLSSWPKEGSNMSDDESVMLTKIVGYHASKGRFLGISIGKMGKKWKKDPKIGFLRNSDGLKVAWVLVTMGLWISFPLLFPTISDFFFYKFFFSLLENLWQVFLAVKLMKRRAKRGVKFPSLRKS